MSDMVPLRGFKNPPGTDEFLAEYRKVKRSLAMWDFVVEWMLNALIMLLGMMLIWLVLIFFANYDAYRGF